ncbi:MAG: hypothetical protein ACXV45_04685 [Halobacteriota archaeon]
MTSQVAFFIAVAVFACIFVAGCTSTTTNSPSNDSTSHVTSVSQSATTTKDDKVLRAVINDDEQAYVSATWTRTVKKSIEWTNDTTAKVTFKLGYRNGSTLQYTARYLKLANDEQASGYVRSINKGYNKASAASLKYDFGLTTATRLNHHQNYKNATSRLSTTNAYEKVRDDGSTYQGSYIVRVNEVVSTFNMTIVKSVAPPKPAR